MQTTGFWPGVLFGALLMLGALSCDDPNRAFTRAEKKLIDSFYHKELVVLQQELDTLCSLQHDSIFESKFDSIYSKRERERLEIMGNYKPKYPVQ